MAGPQVVCTEAVSLTLACMHRLAFDLSHVKDMCLLQALGAGQAALVRQMQQALHQGEGFDLAPLRRAQIQLPGPATLSRGGSIAAIAIRA